jgi:hypothetical protein
VNYLRAVVGRLIDCACGLNKGSDRIFFRCRAAVVSLLQILRFLCLCSSCAVILATSYYDQSFDLVYTVSNFEFVLLYLNSMRT